MGSNQTTVTKGMFMTALAGLLVIFTEPWLVKLGYDMGALRTLLEVVAVGLGLYFLPADFPARKKPPTSTLPPLVALLVGAALLVPGLAQAETDLARIVVTSKPTYVDNEQFDADGESLGFALVTTGTAAEAYFAPMVTVSLVRVNLKRRADYRAGVVPGVGYGFHWSPSWYDKSGDSPFLSAGVFLEGGLQLSGEGADFAVFTILPAVTILRWFSVGFGYERRISLTDGVKDDGAPILALGIASAF